MTAIDDTGGTDRFAENSWNGDPSLTDEWAKTAIDHPARRLEPIVCDGRLVTRLGVKNVCGLAIGLPLTRYDGGFTALPDADPDHLDNALARWSRSRALLLPLCDRQVAEAIYDRVPHAIVRPHDVAPFIPELDVDAWLRRRSKHLRSTTGIARRRLQRVGGEIQCTAAGRLSDHWPELTEVERFGHRRSGHIMSAPFVRDAFVALDLAGKVETWVIRLDRFIAAYALTCVAPRSVYVYTTAMRCDAAAYSPGNVLFESIIVEALARGKSIQLGPGGSSFKHRFTRDVTPLDDLLVLPAGARWATRAIRFASSRLRDRA